MTTIEFLKSHRSLFNLKGLANGAGLNYDRLQNYLTREGNMPRHEVLRLEAYLKYISGLIREMHEEKQTLPESVGDCRMAESQPVEPEEICRPFRATGPGTEDAPCLQREGMDSGGHPSLEQGNQELPEA